MPGHAQGARTRRTRFHRLPDPLPRVKATPEGDSTGKASVFPSGFLPRETPRKRGTNDKTVVTGPGPPRRFTRGLLHVLGYDHESDAGEMRAKECEVIEKFSLPKSLIVRTQDASEE